MITINDKIISNRYKDIDISFRKNPSNNDIYILTDIDAVKRSVKTLILTDFNERLFNPKLGSAVYFSLFENFGPETSILLEKSIKDVISNYEPRAKIIKVDVKENIQSHALIITVFFYIVNVEEIVTININLERVR